MDIVSFKGNVPNSADMLWIFIIQRTAYDHIYQFIHRYLLKTYGTDILAVTDNRRTLTDTFQFCHAV